MLWGDFSWPFRIGWVDLISGLQGNGALLFGFDSDCPIYPIGCVDLINGLQGNGALCLRFENDCSLHPPSNHSYEVQKFGHKII